MSSPHREPRTPTIGRQRILADQESIGQKIREWAEIFAGPAPALTGSTLNDCYVRPRLCYGQCENFDIIGRWTAPCTKKQHKTAQRTCTKVRMLTPRLEDWQLDLLHDLWVSYDRLGKKWAKADVPEHFYERHKLDNIHPAQSTSQSCREPSNGQSPLSRSASAATASSRSVASSSHSASTATSTTGKRKRSVSHMPVAGDIIDVASPPAKKRPYIWVDVIDLTT